MTFGLIEHNALALCSYFSDGRKSADIPSASRVGNEKYNFQISLINEFLTLVMNNKYNKKPVFYQYQTQPKQYHIQKLIPFPAKSLCDEDDRLIIIIPDLHLHFFKGTYLDNFVTYYESRWDINKPGDKFTGKRCSMEKEFGEFLVSIVEFQKKHYRTQVIFLGDTYEMWETQRMIGWFCIRKLNINGMSKAYYETLKEIKETGIIVEGSEFAGVVNEFLRINFPEKPTDPELVNQINVLSKSSNINDIYIEINDSGNEIQKKASNLKNAILDKYKDMKGTTFYDLFDSVLLKAFYQGNHDNFLGLSSLDGFNSLALNVPNDNIYKVGHFSTTENSSIFVHHGHLFDKSNQDAGCFIGYLVTGLCAIHEAIKSGDEFKKLEDKIFPFDKVREDLIKWSNDVFRLRGISSKSDPKDKKNPKTVFNIIIQAHTHKPDLFEFG